MPLAGLSLFSPVELSSAVAGGVSATDRDEFWSLDHLRKTIAADHGYRHQPFYLFINLFINLFIH